MIWRRVEIVGLLSLLVLGLAGCATSRVENQMQSCSLLNLDSTDLRDTWTEEDFEFLLRQKERLFALIAVHALPPVAPIDNNFELEHEFVLINQRQPTPADMHEGYVHPRDLPLTGAAYRALIGRAQEYVGKG